jgi:hypothetical protein
LADPVTAKAMDAVVEAGRARFEGPMNPTAQSFRSHHIMNSVEVARLGSRFRLDATNQFSSLAASIAAKSTPSRGARVAVLSRLNGLM